MADCKRDARFLSLLGYKFSFEKTRKITKQQNKSGGKDGFTYYLIKLQFSHNRLSLTQLHIQFRDKNLFDAKHPLIIFSGHFPWMTCDTFGGNADTI